MHHTSCTAKATNANARITAGLATDIATSFDPMVMARTATLPGALGAPIGSPHTHHRTAKNIYPCAACGTITPAGFSIPAHPTTDELCTELELELELELIQSHMTQKPMLRGEVGACRITQLTSTAKKQQNVL